MKTPLAEVFSCEFCEISKNTFFTEHLRTAAAISANQIATAKIKLTPVNVEKCIS